MNEYILLVIGICLILLGVIEVYSIYLLNSYLREFERVNEIICITKQGHKGFEDKIINLYKVCRKIAIILSMIILLLLIVYYILNL